MKKFCVVRFVEEDAVAVVPSCWLKGNAKQNSKGYLQGMFYWPPSAFRGQKLVRAIMSEHPPSANFGILEAVILKTKDTPFFTFQLTRGFRPEQRQGPEKTTSYDAGAISFRDDEAADDLSPLLAPRTIRSSENVFADSLSEEANPDVWLAPEDSGDRSAPTCSDKDTARAILRELHDIKQQNIALMKIVKQKGTQASTVMMEDLPLHTEEEVKSIESRLEDKELYSDLVAAFSFLGGNQLRQKVTVMMRRLLSDSLGQQYSCFGAKGKRPFCSLNICGVLKDAIRRNRGTAHATDREIESCIRTWLKNCVTRISLRQKGGSENHAPSTPNSTTDHRLGRHQQQRN
ncbi:uncharacterized protein LOC135396568 isoform X2 [Ornithodoros turicata]|uniref:uncharacterized protein LOC135396568 isoform X2 n=1 Tax=Ornithodoros turicata TaxID=34597 RepID=UPI0031393382